MGRIAPEDAKTPDLRCARKDQVQLPGSGATPPRYPAATTASMGTLDSPPGPVYIGVTARLLALTRSVTAQSGLRSVINPH